MESYINRYPNQLSIGENQRVSLLRCFVNSPKLVIADEPAAVAGNIEVVHTALKHVIIQAKEKSLGSPSREINPLTLSQKSAG